MTQPITPVLDELEEILTNLAFELVPYGQNFKSEDVKTALAAIQTLIADRERLARETVEYWQPYDAVYDVSTLGRVRRGGRIIKQCNRGNGYQSITTSISNKQRSQLVHRMIASTFIPNPEGKPCTNHIDGIRSNNVVTNLEWVTYKENERHSYDVLGKVAWNKNVFMKPKCKNGHALSTETTHRKPNGARCCKKCSLLNTANWRARNRLKASNPDTDVGEAV